MKKIAFLLLFSLPYALHAQTDDIFIRILDATGTAINGEATQPGFVNQIQGLSFAQENSSCKTVTNTSCNVKAGQFSLNYQIDRSSVRLKKSLFMGELLQTVDISFVRNGTSGGAYITIRLERVVVTAFAEGAGGSVPTCTISFDASRIGWTYRPFNANGTLGTAVKFGWDVLNNVEWTGF